MKEEIIIRNEAQFAEWFKENYEKFGFSKIVRGDISRCPDFIMLRGREKIRVELETLASNFILHKHSLNDVDEIICLIKDINLSKPIIVAKDAKHNLPKTTSIKIDNDLWKKFKIHCIRIEKEISEYLEELIKDNLKKGGKDDKK